MKKSTSSVSRFNINSLLTESIKNKLDVVKMTDDKFETDGFTKKLGLISGIIGS